MLVAKSPNTTKTATAHTLEAFPALKSDAACEVQSAMKALTLICSPCFPALPHDGTQRYAIPCWRVERKCRHTERWRTLTHLTTYELHLSAQPTVGIDAPNNFANLRTKVDQLLLLQVAMLLQVAKSSSGETGMNGRACCPARVPKRHKTSDTVKQHYLCFVDRTGRVYHEQRAQYYCNYQAPFALDTLAVLVCRQVAQRVLNISCNKLRNSVLCFNPALTA